jgi:hypothetical protein
MRTVEALPFPEPVAVRAGFERLMFDLPLR